MKKFTLLIIVVITSITTLSQSLTTSYVDGYKILKGERPTINLRDFPVDAYQQGKIKIKIDKSYEMQLPDIRYRADYEGFVKTGIVELDNLNAQFQVKSYTPLFSMLYETHSKSSDFSERHRAWGFHLWFTIELDENVSIADAVEAYQALPFVEIAEPFYSTKLHDSGNISKWTPNDPRISNQWHYHNTGQANGTPGCDISLFKAWEIEKGYDKVIVAVIDCGIQENHPDLEANMWSQVGYNFLENSSTIDPGNHGCHVGGTVAAVTNNGIGVAGIAGGSGNGDGVRLMTCQIFNPDGNAAGGIENSFIYAADNGACISQNSWGYINPNVYEQSVLDGIDYFLAHGGGEIMEDGIVIFAAGNVNSKNNYYPGCYEPVLAVAATDNSDKKASYSNFGIWVEISAPGGDGFWDEKGYVLSCMKNSTYGYGAGTSMAAPHVSGAAALLVSYAARNGYLLSRQQIRDLLLNSVDNHYPANKSYYDGLLGTGRLNAYEALLEFFDMISGIYNPNNVNASSISYSEIELHWQNTNDNVMVLANTAKAFGVPEKGVAYQVGDLLPEGGTVIYCGNAETFIHSGLSSSTTYYYKIFSCNDQSEYSRGQECQATTWCGIVENSFFEGFEIGLNRCWVQEQVIGNTPWVLGKGNGASSPNQAYEGVSNIYFKDRSTNSSELGNISRFILPSIKMAEFDQVQLSFALYNRKHKETDELSIYYKTSTSTYWQFWKMYNNSQTDWSVKSIRLPENVNTDELYICFQGKLNGGYGICIDNIRVEKLNTNSINNNDLDSKISIYPNPTTGGFKVQEFKNSRVQRVEVFDIYSRKLFEDCNSYGLMVLWSYDLTVFPSGIYFVKITTETGIITKKIVKL